MNKSRKHCFNIQTLCSISDTYVNSILSYGSEIRREIMPIRRKTLSNQSINQSEILGFHKAQDVEKVHLSFCKKKKIFGVNKVCNNMVYVELYRFQLYIARK